MVNLTNELGISKNQNVNVTYKGVTYNVELKNSNLYVDGSYLCPFEYDGIDWKSEQHLIDEIYDCVGGWVEGYEVYSLRANTNLSKNRNLTLKEYLTKEWLNYKEEWSKGSTPEELLNYTQPTEGDLECLVQRMEGVNFDTTLNQALKVFNYIK